MVLSSELYKIPVSASLGDFIQGRHTHHNCNRLLRKFGQEHKLYASVLNWLIIGRNSHFKPTVFKGGKMGKYLVLWDLDTTRIPVDPKKRRDASALLTALVKNDIEKGIQKDYGAFVGETKGYGIVEGSEIEVSLLIQQFIPYVKFEVKPIMSISQVEEMLNTMQV
jgi:hypothetical protein